MRPWKQRWWIYRPRIAWYVASLLFCLLAPGDLAGPVRFYLGFTVFTVVIAFLGVDPTFFWQIRESGRVPKGFAWVHGTIGGVGAAAAGLGLVLGNDTLYCYGVVGIVVGVDCALWAREVNCRHRLEPPPAPRTR